jgi:CysZ protein
LLKEIVIAIQAWGRAHQFIVTHKLWKWILVPGIIYALLFGFSMSYFIGSADDAVNWISRQLRVEGWLQQKRSEWLSFFFVMMGIMLRLLLLLLYFSFFKYIILILGAPVFAYLSEKTQSIIEGREFSFSFKQLQSDIVRGIKMALRNCGWQTVYMVALVLLALLPVVGWISPLVALLVEVYFYGFSMLDYSCMRQKMDTPHSIEFTGRHKGLAIGNGIVFYLAHGLLVIGWIVAPAYAVVAATLSLQQDNQ